MAEETKTGLRAQLAELRKRVTELERDRDSQHVEILALRAQVSMLLERTTNPSPKPWPSPSSPPIIYEVRPSSAPPPRIRFTA